MTDDHRRRDDVVADPAVLEVVHVRATDSDRRDLDQHLPCLRERDRSVLDPDITRAVQDCAGILQGVSFDIDCLVVDPSSGREPPPLPRPSLGTADLLD
jgi:hypothetical protein